MTIVFFCSHNHKIPPFSKKSNSLYEKIGKNTLVLLYDCMLNREKVWDIAMRKNSILKEKIFRKMAVIKKNSQTNCGFLYVFSWLSHKFLFSPCVGVSFTKTFLERLYADWALRRHKTKYTYDILHRLPLSLYRKYNIILP